MVYNCSEDLYASIENGKISVTHALKKLRKAESLTAVDGRTDKLAKKQKINKILLELDSLVGLEEVKKVVKEIYAFIEICKYREQQQLINDPMVLHMIFKGNPGTGKTTVARIMGRIFYEMNILTKGHLIEIERADLVGEYIGQTAQKARDQIKKALGGILFIDEAYSLARGGEKDFGKECIDVLVKAMEDHKNDFILILAGYKNEMEYFLQTNPGLRSRFPIYINFPDYSKEELLKIADLMCTKRQYKLSVEARQKLLSRLDIPVGNKESFGNARTVRNIIEKAIRRQALRLLERTNITRQDLMTIEAEDLMEGE